ncbi:MAG: GntR family transcriptional regulator [Planctomycetota bacterium]
MTTRSLPKYKYLEIAHDIRGKIQQGRFRANELLPSQNDLMQEYGVALATVRQVLGELQNDGLVESFRGKGTFVRDLSKDIPNWQVDHFVGLAMIDVAEGREPIPHDCFMGLHQQVQGRGKELLLRWLPASQAEELCAWSKRVGAVILYCGVTETMVRQVVECGSPAIVAGYMKEGKCPDGASMVYADPADSVNMAVGLLHNTGHRRIKLVLQPGHGYARRSEQAFRKCLGELGLDPDDPGVFHTRDIKKDLRDHGESIIKEILKSKPDAIFCISGNGACYFVTELNRMGVRVPGDISVLAGHCAPPVDLPIRDLSVVYDDLSGILGRAVSLALDGVIKQHVYRQVFAPKLYFGKTVRTERVRCKEESAC